MYNNQPDWDFVIDCDEIVINQIIFFIIKVKILTLKIQHIERYMKNIAKIMIEKGLKTE